MNINIKGTSMELTDAIRDYVHDKLEGLEKVLRDHETVFVQVEVGRDSKHHAKGDVFRAEVDIRAAGNSFYAEARAEDLYAAIDLVRDEILEKVRSHKDKDHSRLVRGGRKIKNLIKGIWQ